MNTLIFLALLTGSAQAQDSFDSHGFKMVPSDGELLDGVRTLRSEEHDKGVSSLDILAEHSHDPVVLQTTSGSQVTRDSLISGVTSAHVGGTYSPTSDLSFRASMPVYLLVNSEMDKRGVGTGDLRLMADYRIASSDSMSLTGAVFGDVPGTYAQHGMGFTKPSGGLTLAGTASVDRAELTANVSYEIAPEVSAYNLSDNDFITSAIMAGVMVTDDLALRGEFYVKNDLTKNELSQNVPSELTLSARGRVDDSLSWTLGGSTATSMAASAAEWRLFAGVNFAFGRIEDVPVEIPVVEEPEEPAEEHDEPVVIIVEDEVELTPQPVYFDFDSDRISGLENWHRVDTLVDLITSLDEPVELEVHGYADTRGSDLYNVDLSERRIGAVMSALDARGVSLESMREVPHGEYDSDDCSTESCHQMFRKVEVRIVPAE